jgi:hypothetical protein
LTPIAADRSPVRFGAINLRGEGSWLAAFAVLAVLELGWWAVCWRAGTAPPPRLGTYGALALAALTAALLLKRALPSSAERASWPAILLGTMLVALGASLMLPLKYAIPAHIPFWLDAPLAAGERHLFGTDPWKIVDGLFGWALVPVDRAYGLWLPVQSLALFSAILLPASPAKTRALISYSLSWFLLGVVAALFCSSVGPIFYDRLLGGHDFSALDERLRAGAWMARADSDAMWTSFVTGEPGLAAGMSAMPSLHVAISFWMWLAARSVVPRIAPLALAYAIFIWIASVQLGWHYVSDGLAGMLGMLAIWWLVQRIVPDPLQASD